MNKQQNAKAATLEYLRQADIVLTKDEQQRIEIATFGLADYPVSGLQLLTYVNSPGIVRKSWCSFRGRPAQSICIRLSPARPVSKRLFVAVGGRYFCLSMMKT